MRILYLTLFLIAFSIAAQAQLKKTVFQNRANLPQKYLNPSNVFKSGSRPNFRVAESCAYDTIDYAFQKKSINPSKTQLNYLYILNTDGNASTIGQYFPCPQP